MSDIKNDYLEGQTFDDIKDQLERWERAFDKKSALTETKSEALNLKAPKITCDCGGEKTYKSLNPMYHAAWCSLLK